MFEWGKDIEVPFDLSQLGGTLKTAALRPVGIYGEGETAMLAEIMKKSLIGTGTIVKLSYWRKQHDNDHQIIYAGNAAWAHLCTMKSLCESPKQCGGEAYFVTDDTPPGHYNSLCAPFVHAAGLKYACFSLSCRLYLALLYIFELVLYIVSSVFKYEMSLTTCTMHVVNLNATFSRKKLETRCKYSPIFSYSDSLKRSIPYYKSVLFQTTVSTKNTSGGGIINLNYCTS